MKRSRIKSRRAAPRRREAPQWTREEWEAADRLLQRRAGGRCECCGAPLNGRCERHHRVRRRDGGDRVANLLVLRPGCHAYWTAHPAEARGRGIIVPVGTDPASVPVALYRGGVTDVWLDDLGTLLRTPPTPGRRDTPEGGPESGRESGCDQHPGTDRGHNGDGATP